MVAAPSLMLTDSLETPSSPLSTAKYHSRQAMGRPTSTHLLHQAPSLLTIPSHASSTISPLSPSVDTLIARLGVQGADYVLTPTVLSAVARKGSITSNHLCEVQANHPPNEDMLFPDKPGGLTIQEPSTVQRALLQAIPDITLAGTQPNSTLVRSPPADETITATLADIPRKDMPQRTFSSESVSSMGSGYAVTANAAVNGSTSSLGMSGGNSSASTPGSAKKSRGRRMSSHVTLANTSVGLREIAKQIGKAVLKWESSPKTILIVTKVHDPELVRVTRTFADWLLSQGMAVWVEDRLKDDPLFGWTNFIEEDDMESSNDSLRTPIPTTLPTLPTTPPQPQDDHDLSPSPSPSSTASSFATTTTTCSTPSTLSMPPLKFWNARTIETDCGSSLDLIVTLGGDGTVLFTASLFQTIRVPPIIPFDLGSLGFLAVFEYARHREILSTVTTGEEGFAVNMRMRLACTVYRRRFVEGEESVIPERTFHVLNELVVDRGPSPYMSELELFVDDAHLTTMQADGLVIATPTGSTAYSLSANGSMVHPAVPTILIRLYPPPPKSSRF
ncbi:NAD(+) kinase [Dinochytrium kinnereticum]|nr:NAD(+) kinase [Dinochytrium kinnereticum]